MSEIVLDPPGYVAGHAPVRFRNTPPAPAPAPTPPAPAPTPAPAPPQQRNTGPRTSAQIQADRAAMIAEAEGLQTRAATAPLSAEEDARFDYCLTEAERLAGELATAQRAERLTAQRAALQQPARPAPAPGAGVVTPQTRNAGGTAEGLRLWLRSFTDEADFSTDARFRAQQSGFPIGSTSARMQCDFGGSLNKAKRRAISKGGTNTGAELIPKTYADRVTEYITFFSSLIGYVDSEVTADGNDRTYFRIDDTALISSYITASSGTELEPTIPDVDIATGAVVIKAFEITSGYHKLTRQALRDSAVTLEDKVAKAVANAHARRIERDMILGGGTTAARGILTAATAYGATTYDDFTADLIEDVYFSVPEQYRNGCIWLTSSSGMARLRRKLKDSTGRSLFSQAIEDGAEVLYLHGRPVVTSSYMPGFAANQKPLVFFHPMMYMLRLVEGQMLDVLKEKFHPHIGYASGMAFGGDYLGPANTNICITLDANPGNGS
jgi:HK97 family phage major capsid protein